MRSPDSALSIRLFAATLVVCTIACSDVGDTSPPCGSTPALDATTDGSSVDTGDSGVGATGDDGGGADDGAGDDSVAIGAGSVPGAATDDAGATTGPSSGATTGPSSGAEDAKGDDGGVPDADGTTEGGSVEDALDASVDTAVRDSGSDAGPIDSAATHDASLPETGAFDSGGVDASLDSIMPEAEAGDASTGDATLDSGGHDAGPSDTGTDADSHCSTHKRGAPCTPTEELFIQHDPTFGCYECLVMSGCLDDTDYTTDINHECEDVKSDGGSITLDGGPPEQACLDTIQCILANHCGDPTGAGKCYCGTSGSMCLNAGAPNGACVAAETNGLDTSDPTNANKAFTNTALPSGMANAIFACAGTNSCTACLPP